MPEDLTAPWDGSVPSAATAVVKRIEGFSAVPYPDNPGNANNTWTIGYGTIRDLAGNRITPHTPPVTEGQAEALVIRDMQGAAADVHARVHVPLLMREAAALISWTYNLGGDALRMSTLLARLNAGDKAGVPSEMRKWINQGHEPLLGLLRRRWAEAAIFVGVDPAIACDRAWAEIVVIQDWPGFDAGAALDTAA